MEERILRNGKVLKINNIEKSLTDDTNVLDITDDYQQLQFDNEKLGANLSVLENEVEESVGKYKQNYDKLVEENKNMTEMLRIYKGAATFNDQLKVQIIKLEEQVEVKSNTIYTLSNDIRNLEQEVASKDEVIKILRQQLMETEVEQQVSDFSQPKKTFRNKQQVNYYSTIVKNKFGHLQLNDPEDSRPVESVQVCDPAGDRKLQNTKLAKHKSQLKTKIINHTNKINPQKQNILMLADSHGRNLYHHLESMWPCSTKMF